MKDKFDLIIMVTKKDISLLSLSIPYIRRYIKAFNVICVGKEILKSEIEKLGVFFLNEDDVFEGMTLQKVRKLISDRGGDDKRAGWYFQQFLKITYCYICPDDYYVVWDADTIPLSRIEYFRDDKPLLMKKKEYHKPYFDTINILFDGSIGRYDKNVSFIAENMIINKKIMIEMIDVIQKNDKIKGNNVYEKIINSISPNDLNKSGFSEFETYGNYIMFNHPFEVELIHRNSIRIGAFVVGYHPNSAQLDWIGKRYEIISIENKSNNIISTIWATWFSLFTKSKLFRITNDPYNVAKHCIKIINFQNLLHGRKNNIDYDIDIEQN